MSTPTEIVPRTEDAQIAAPSAELDWSIAARRALAAKQARDEMVASVLVKDSDYGVIPGTGSKATLLKPGAEKILDALNLWADYVSEEAIERTSDTDPLYLYRFRAVLRQRGSNNIVTSGIGTCSSLESRYRWRKSERTCPQCGKSNIRKSKQGGGWYCWAKVGGCGAQFPDNDPKIIGQEVGRMPNPDIHDCQNTVCKMAQKRALVAAVLNLGLSDRFTQDLDDNHSHGDDEPPPQSTVKPVSSVPATRSQSVPTPEPKPTKKTTAAEIKAHIERCREVLLKRLAFHGENALKFLQERSILLPGEPLQSANLIQLFPSIDWSSVYEASMEQVNAWIKVDADKLMDGLAKFANEQDGDLAPQKGEPPPKIYPATMNADEWEASETRPPDPPVARVSESERPIVTDADTEADEVIGTVLAYSKPKEGQGRNGKAYVKYSFKLGEDWYGSFSKTLYDQAIAAKNSGATVRVRFTSSKFGRDAIDMQTV